MKYLNKKTIIVSIIQKFLPAKTWLSQATDLSLNWLPSIDRRINEGKIYQTKFAFRTTYLANHFKILYHSWKKVFRMYFWLNSARQRVSFTSLLSLFSVKYPYWVDLYFQRILKKTNRSIKTLRYVQSVIFLTGHKIFLRRILSVS